MLRQRKSAVWSLSAVGAQLALGLVIWALTAALRKPEPAGFAPYSVAVLPFAAPSNDPASVELADRLTRDLATALTTAFNRRGYVASSEGLDARRARSVDARTAGRSLDVANVVGGDLSRSAGSVAVSVRVVDTVTGKLAWSETTRFEAAEL
jgi:TolB-like protein